MNSLRRNLMGTAQPGGRLLGAGDGLIILGLVVLLYAGIRLASPTPVVGPEIDLSPSALPWYAFLSVIRLTASYILSLVFALVFAYIAAHNRSAERFMLPLLDVLQSVPLLSFLPVVVITLTALLPSRLGIEASAIVLIFTSQAWNMAFSFHQSILTVPRELQEASDVFRMNWWYRLRNIELPFGMFGLIWNSIVSWANGWFFLMAAETFRVGDRDFRLLGLGSYLQAAADADDQKAILLGFITLVAVIILLDQLLWRPLLVWAEKFRIDLVSADDPPTSWAYNLFSGSRLASFIYECAIAPLLQNVDCRLGGPLKAPRLAARDSRFWTWKHIAQLVLACVAGVLLIYGAFQVVQGLASVSPSAWGQIALAAAATGGRVAVSLALTLLWTIPVGVAIGTNPRLSAILQPIVQVLASVPATALFPVFVLALIALPFGLNGTAILLMLLGTQWYVLFNVIAGASALPQDLRDIATMFKISGWSRWRTLILPALFPYIVTGLITAAGGAWNASIVAEYTQFNKQTYIVTGLGSIIAQSTASGNYAMLLAATLTMILVVLFLNRFFWRRLYRLAEDKYRIE